MKSHHIHKVNENELLAGIFSLFFFIYIYPHFTDCGVPHIVQQILRNLDIVSLLRAQRVCVLWYNLIIFAPLWKELINKTVKSDKVWKELSEKRGW